MAGGGRQFSARRRPVPIPHVEHRADHAQKMAGRRGRKLPDTAALRVRWPSMVLHGLLGSTAAAAKTGRRMIG